MSERRHVCPKCQRGNYLWQTVMVSGYITVDEYLKQIGIPDADGVYWDDQDEFGCSECDWRGFERDLVQMGIDDEPLPYIHPEQMFIVEAA